MPQTRIACLAFLALSLPCAAQAATYTVGPAGRQFRQLSDVFQSRNLAPGDVVLVDGGATYAGDIVVGDDDSGAAGNPVVIRWNRPSGGSRPVLQGGMHTIKFQQSNHIVFDGFDVRGGSRSCVFSEADDVTVRDSVIHACPAHGILGADNNSGSFTLEYSEVHDAGAGTQKHAIYMQSDETVFPNAVFRMRYNYVHDGNGGNLLKVRHQRSEIHYNWFEGSAYQEMELIGPDCETQQGGWSAGLKREDSDIVGNVIVHTSQWPNAIRAGGDLNGRSEGRVRMVNNTVIFDRPGAATMIMVQLGLGSLEMHNNVVYQTGGVAPAILTENPASDVETPYCAPFGREPWSSGRKVAGSGNWFQNNASKVPSELTATIRGSDPKFASIAQRALRPLADSPLIDAGDRTPEAPAGFPFPSPLVIPHYDPPMHTKLAIGDEHPRVVQARDIDIGAFEEKDVDDMDKPLPMNGAQPLLPPKSSQPGQGAAGSLGTPMQGPLKPGQAVEREAVAVPTYLAWFYRILHVLGLR